MIAKVPTLTTYLADAASKGGKQLVQIVVYDLPDRDCAAAASNGEFSIANGGAAKYKECVSYCLNVDMEVFSCQTHRYIDGIVTAIKAYPTVRVVAIIEPDSLANMVTNMNVAKCSNAAATYKNSTIYAIQQLNLNNVYMYVYSNVFGLPFLLTPRLFQVPRWCESAPPHLT